MPKYEVTTDLLLGHWDPSTSDPTGRHRFQRGEVITVELVDGVVPGDRVWDEEDEEWTIAPRVSKRKGKAYYYTSTGKRRVRTGKPTSDLVPGTVVRQRTPSKSWVGLVPAGFLREIKRKAD